MILATARSSAMKRRVGSVPAATALKSTYGLLRESYEPLPPMRTFTKSKPGNDAGLSSAGYIVVAPPMFTSSRSDGVSPTVSNAFSVRESAPRQKRGDGPGLGYALLLTGCDTEARAP